MKKVVAHILIIMMCFGVFSQAAEAKSIETKTWDYLTKKVGCSPQAAAGIMGNIMLESGFKPKIKGHHVGLFQLSYTNFARLKRYCKKNDTKWYKAEAQLAFGTKVLSKEIKMFTKYSWKKFKKFKSVTRAAYIWEKGVERSGGSGNHLRIKYAKKYYKKYLKRYKKWIAKKKAAKRAKAAAKRTVVARKMNVRMVAAAIEIDMDDMNDVQPSQIEGAGNSADADDTQNEPCIEDEGNSVGTNDMQDEPSIEDDGNGTGTDDTQNESGAADGGGMTDE